MSDNFDFVGPPLPGTEESLGFVSRSPLLEREIDPGLTKPTMGNVGQCPSRPHTDCSHLDENNFVRRAASGYMCKEEVLTYAHWVCKSAELMICCPTDRRKMWCEWWFWTSRTFNLVPTAASLVGGLAGRAHPAVATAVAAFGTWLANNAHLFDAMILDMYMSDLCDCGVAVSGRCFANAPGSSIAQLLPGTKPLTKDEIKALITAIPHGGYCASDDTILEGGFEDLTFDGE